MVLWRFSIAQARFLTPPLVATLLLASLGLAAPPEARHQLGDSEAKLKFLLYVNEHVPSIFNDSVNHDIDLFQLLTKQSFLMERVERDPLYQKLQETRPTRTEISVQPAEARSGAAVDTRRIEQLRAHLAREYQRVVVADPAGLPGEILARAARLAQVNPQGFITGLIKTLPKEKQGEVFKMSMTDKLAALARDLPDELISKGFLASNFGIQERAFSREKAMRMLTGLVRDEAELRGLTTIQLLLQDSLGNISSDRDAALGKIRRVTGEQIIRLSEKAVLEDGVRRFLSSTSVAQDKKLPSILAQGVQTAAKALKSEPAPVFPPGKPGRALRLSEVAPHIGIFRGCVGGDCSSRFSFPYPNSPNEKVFFVHGPDGATKGYVSATLVNANGKPSLYLHTLAGARLSRDEAETIIQALHDTRKELGAEQVVLGVDSAIQRTVNYDPLREALKSAVSGNPEIRIEYPDAPLREHMKPFDKGTFDHPETNLVGRIYSPSGERKVEIAVQVRDVVMAPLVDRPIDRTQALEIGLRLHQAGRLSSAARIVEAAGIPLQAYRDLRALLENPGQLPLADQFQRLDAQLKPYGVTSRQWLERRPSLLTVGILKAPDAFDEAHRAKTLSLVKQSASEQPFLNQLAALLADQGFFESGKSDQIIEALLKERKTVSDRAVVFLLKQGGYSRNASPKVGEYLMTLAKTGNVDVEMVDGLMNNANFISNPQSKNVMAEISARGKTDPALAKVLINSSWRDRLAEIPEVVQSVLKSGRADIESLEIVTNHRLRDTPELVEHLKRTLSKPGQEAGLVSGFLKNSDWRHPFAHTALEELVKRHVIDPMIVKEVYQSPNWASDPKAWDYLGPIADKGLADHELIERLRASSSNPIIQNPQAASAMEKLVRRGAVDAGVGLRLLEPEWYSRPEAERWFETVFQRGRADSELATALMGQLFENDSAKATRYLETLLARGNADDSIARMLASSRWIFHPKRDEYIAMILKGRKTGTGAAWLLAQPMIREHPRYLEWVEELTHGSKVGADAVELLSKDPVKTHEKIGQFLERVLRNSATHERFLTQAADIPEWQALPQFTSFVSRIADAGSSDQKLIELLPKYPGFLAHPDSYEAMKKIVVRGRAAGYVDQSIGTALWAQHPKATELALDYIDNTQDVDDAFRHVLQKAPWQKNPRFHELVQAAMRLDPQGQKLIYFLASSGVSFLPHSEEWLAEAIARRDIDYLLEKSVFSIESWQNHPAIKATGCVGLRLKAECLRNAGFGKAQPRTNLVPVNCSQRFHI